MDKFKPYAFLLLAALFYTLGFPNIFSVYIPFLPMVGVGMMMYFVFYAHNTRTRFYYYFFYNLIINILSFYWITGTLQEFGKMPFIVAALANGAFTFVFNPYYSLVIILLHFVEKLRPELKKYYFKNGMFVFCLSAFLTSLEYFLPQQFPVMLGQPWIIFSEYLGFAPYLGIPIYSFMSYLLAFEVVKAYSNKTLSYVNSFTLLIFILINPFLVAKENSNEETINFYVRLVQANISNFLKVESELGGYASVQTVLSRYEALSNQEFFKERKPEKVDLIVWPETAYPYPIHTNKENITETLVPNIFHQIGKTTGAALLIGGYDHFKDNPDGSYYQTEYNSSLYFDQNQKLKDVYHKHVLIPFGETLPLGPLNQFVSKYLAEMAFFAEGKEFPVFKTEKGVKFINSICYEILRPEFVRSYLNNNIERPHLMINLTNDSWYGNTVEPEQHLFLAKWRSIEFNLPIIRSTNTGISTYIKANGREQKRLNYDSMGNLDLSITLPKNVEKNDQTVYQRFGFVSILPVWLLYFIFHYILIKLDNE